MVSFKFVKEKVEKLTVDCTVIFSNLRACHSAFLLFLFLFFEKKYLLFIFIKFCVLQFLVGKEVAEFWGLKREFSF